MTPDRIKHARLVLTQAWLDDPDLKRSYVDNAAMCLHDMQAEREGLGLAGGDAMALLDMRDKATRDEAATRILDWLFPKKDLEAGGVPLAPTPPGAKRRLLGEGERFYHPQTRKLGVIVDLKNGTYHVLAHVRFDDGEFGLIIRSELIEPP
jgi:hypothetical protein